MIQGPDVLVNHFDMKSQISSSIPLQWNLMQRMLLLSSFGKTGISSNRVRVNIITFVRNG